MPPATATSRSPHGDALRRQHHGSKARAAHHVDRDRASRFGQATAQRRLAGGILAEPRGDDVAHVALVDRRRRNTRAPHGLGYHERAQIGRAEVLERAEELSGGRPNGGDDHDIAHTLRLRTLGLRAPASDQNGRSISSDDVVAEERLQPSQDDGRRARHLARPLRARRLDNSVSPSRCTLVARSIAGPTTAVQANRTLPGEAGSRAADCAAHRDAASFKGCTGEYLLSGSGARSGLPSP